MCTRTGFAQLAKHRCRESAVLLFLVQQKSRLQLTTKLTLSRNCFIRTVIRQSLPSGVCSSTPTNCLLQGAKKKLMKRV